MGNSISGRAENGIRSEAIVAMRRDLETRKCHGIKKMVEVVRAREDVNHAAAVELEVVNRRGRKNAP